MSTEDPGNINYSDVGGLGEQIRELREVSGVTSGCGQHVTKFRCGCGIFVRRNFVIICECLESEEVGHARRLRHCFADAAVA